jgi:uncharacterized protein
MSMINVCIAWHWPDNHGELMLQLHEGATVSEALDAASQHGEMRVLIESAVSVGVWGKVTARSHSLRDQDRVELYRALKADPKEARRQRADKPKAPVKTTR